jgi:hypothetical protein
MAQGSIFGSAGLGAPQLSKPPKKQNQPTPPPNINQWNTPGASNSSWTTPSPRAGGAGASGVAGAGGALLGPPQVSQNPAPAPAPAANPAPAPAPPPVTDRNDPNFVVQTNPGDEGIITQAGAQYTSDTGAALRDIVAAAIAYGDPAILAQWGLNPTQSPDSALALAALQHQRATNASNQGAETGGNFFTSIHGRDLGNIDTDQANANLAAKSAYDKAFGDYGTAMTNAAIKRDNAINAAHQHERDTTPLPTVAPTPTAGTGAGAQPTNTLPPGVTAGNVPDTLGGKTINQWWNPPAPVPVANWTTPQTNRPRSGGRR